jgi:hypothetical protein
VKKRNELKRSVTKMRNFLTSWGIVSF